MLKINIAVRPAGTVAPMTRRKISARFALPKTTALMTDKKTTAKIVVVNTYASMVSKQLSARNVKGLRSAFITSFVAIAKNVVVHKSVFIMLIDENAGPVTLRALFGAVLGTELLGHWDGIKLLRSQRLNSSAVPSSTSLTTSKANLLTECAGNARARFILTTECP